MPLQITSLEIADVKLVVPQRFEDSRGFFSETYNRKAFREGGIETEFCQDNHSLSTTVGTVRGLHYQAPPFAQTKLVRVLRGAIMDVAVDARIASPTYGQWVRAELSAENGHQLLIPQGFLHGFATLTPDTEVAYKVDNYYSKECDGSVRWDDPTLASDWGFDHTTAVLSDKDIAAPDFSNFESPF